MAAIPEQRSVGGAGRGMRAVRLVAWVLAVLCVVIVTATATARSTVLNAGFYRSALDDQHAYDRVFDQVLVDPAVAPVTRDLLGQLPVPEALVTSNLKTVLPPETLRALVDAQVRHLISYLRGDENPLSLSVDLRPLTANIGDVAQIYFGDLVASLQERPVADFAQFRANLGQAMDRLAKGQPPAWLPALSLSEEQAAAATETLLGLVPPGERSALRPDIEVALENGNVAGALAAVGPVAFSDRTREAADHLRGVADGDTWNISADIDETDGTLQHVRAVTRLALDVVEPLALLLAAASLAVLWFTGPKSVPRRLRQLGWALAAGGLVAALAALILGLVTGRQVVGTPASWPEAVSRLVDDVQSAAFDRLLTVAATTALVPITAGTLLVALAWAAERRPEPFATRRAQLAPALGVTAVALAGVALVPLAFAGQSARVCQGSARLCDLPYDELAQVTSHNAMSTTADRFIGPLQDPDISGQLNDGVRALQIDTYHWERPEDITRRLAESDFPPELRAQIEDAVNRFNPPREGPWLCHSVCRAGALELVPTLREVGDWLRAHPSEVLTLIVQDDISGTDTADAVQQAGLKDLLYTPDQDPNRPWPTLGEMIEDDHRLVVFAERADGPAPWYRNFYRYGMETPFAFRAPQDMTCEPHRGGTGKRLFLLNHFITIDGGSRLDAGQVNRREDVLERVHVCERQRGRPVNFVAVDYTTIGDTEGAVDALNAERAQGR
ncbi:PI-PLC domain-containing protein [Streptomyces sp. NBC_00038]|uniref:PI-PLC domain-containing protein n=1 Tax=Streptomyces sp. NBC_00038 TaxID=2903615 RepID=UPI002257E278|nr:PI-PLC domain-containing protein [Streptomyces sp. NBC_00038]MCX5554996.1 PI-PLC domain-containing protein [Streptomyces sp. NBC_00038]